MKKMLFIITAIFIYTSGYNQQTKPQQQLTKQEYLQKSKKQKTTAWIMLGGGTVVSVIGIS